MKYYKHSLDAESIAHALGRKKLGKGYICCCPAHDDRTPSLSITDADNKILFHCFAGCTYEEVICALRSKGLWSELRTKQNCSLTRYTQEQISHAKTILKIAHYDLSEGLTLSDDDREEVKEAYQILKEVGHV